MQSNTSYQQHEGTLTRKGQVTIPAEIREQLGLKPKDKVRFTVEGDTVRLMPAPSKLLAGYGAVTPRKKPEDYGQRREDFEKGVASDVQSES